MILLPKTIKKIFKALNQGWAKYGPPAFFKLIFCLFLTNFVNIWPCAGLKTRAFNCQIQMQTTGLSDHLCHTNDPLIINLFINTQQWLINRHILKTRTI